MRVPITIDNKEISLIIEAESNDSEAIKEVFEEEAAQYGESLYQLKEGCTYEFKISDSKYTITKPAQLAGIIKISSFDQSRGRIVPNTYVGTLYFYICLIADSNIKQRVALEIRSSKSSYRDDYRTMMAEITEYCVDLVLQINSPVNQRLISDFTSDAKTSYQRFAFVKSMLEAPEFTESIHRILASPATTWEDQTETIDVRKLKRISGAVIKQLASTKNRMNLSSDSSLSSILPSLPSRVNTTRRNETVDTPENRFIKNALNTFHQFSLEILDHAKKASKLFDEAQELTNSLQEILNHSFFKDVSSLSHIQLNSPILQRKEGYREILRIWHMFDLASKLTWQGGEDVYEAGKKDVATLYEYWLFFKLLDVFKEMFAIEPKALSDLIEVSTNKMSLKLKAGKHIALSGIYRTSHRSFSIQFAYNRTFGSENAYPEGGSWTKSMRPDYTLSIWPDDLSAEEAERQELIVHLHFDAKYKVNIPQDVFGEDEEVEREAEERTEGKPRHHTRTDLLKMHSYRDAIRRTAGAYILYPGTEKYNKNGFHEILPGIGAFNINPSKNNTGISNFKKFINDVMVHFINRASQREHLAYNLFHVFKEPTSILYNGWFPILSNIQRPIPPQDIHVLVGYYRNKKHLEWIIEKQLYNLRLEGRGSKDVLNPNIFGANLLLLYGPDGNITNKVFEIVQNGPSVYSKKDLQKLHYPHMPSKQEYLVFAIKKIDDNLSMTPSWDVRKLNGYREGRQKGFPFSVNLQDLYNTIVDN